MESGPRGPGGLARVLTPSGTVPPMLHLDLGDAFVAMTAVLLGMLLVLSLYDSWRSRSQGWSLAEESLGECTRCHRMFLVSRYETVARCPRCSTPVQVPGRGANGARARGR